MIYKFLVFNPTSNTLYDYAPIVQEVSYTTNRIGSAGKLEFSYIQDQPINMEEGVRVEFYVDGKGIFLGYVFAIKQSRNGEISVTAYDQIRYLKSKASYSFAGKKSGDIIRQIAMDMQLQIFI